MKKMLVPIEIPDELDTGWKPMRSRIPHYNAVLDVVRRVMRVPGDIYTVNVGDPGVQQKLSEKAAMRLQSNVGAILRRAAPAGTTVRSVMRWNGDEHRYKVSFHLISKVKS